MALGVQDNHLRLFYGAIIFLFIVTTAIPLFAGLLNLAAGCAGEAGVLSECRAPALERPAEIASIALILFMLSGAGYFLGGLTALLATAGVFYEVHQVRRGARTIPEAALSIPAIILVLTVIELILLGTS